ncbi:MAG TPA: DUF6714 family protein [Thermoanaerobaculia bacterium]|jgi:hypothetical protein
MDIEDDLLNAWSTETAPPRDQIASHQCEECFEITAFFGGRPWTDFTDVQTLRYHECALALFTPVAFHYYLPAFMHATLADPIGADVIADSVVSSIRQEFGPADRDRLRLFTPAQRAVVSRFLLALPTVRQCDAEELEELETLAELLGKA